MPVIQQALDRFATIYTQHKPARSISWYTDFGSQVELELELDGQSVRVDAPLPQAQIILLFTEKGGEFRGCRKEEKAYLIPP